MTKSIRKMKERYKVELLKDKTPEEIVTMFEQMAVVKVKACDGNKKKHEEPQDGEGPKEDEDKKEEQDGENAEP